MLTNSSINYNILIDKNEIFHLEKCPDKKAKINATLQINLIKEVNAETLRYTNKITEEKHAKKYFRMFFPSNFIFFLFKNILILF